MKHTITEKTLALLPAIIESEGINVPIYRVEETKTLIRFYLYGRTKPLVVRKPKARARPGQNQAAPSPGPDPARRKAED